MLQSSTATALIAATFSAKKLLAVATAFYMVLGADIGTALAVLVASQKSTVIPPLLLLIGVIGFLSSDSDKRRGVSRALIGVGLVLLSLSLLGSNAEVLAVNAQFMAFLDLLSSNTLLIMIFGSVITCLAHSSLAVVLLTVSLVTSGVFSTETVLYLVLGANLGSGLLPLLASWRSPKNARIPLTANLMIRTLGVTGVYVFADPVLTALSNTVSAAMVPNCLAHIA